MVSIENPKFVCKKSRSEVSNSFTGNENTAAASPATSIEWFEFSVLDPPPIPPPSCSAVSAAFQLYTIDKVACPVHPCLIELATAYCYGQVRII